MRKYKSTVTGDIVGLTKTESIKTYAMNLMVVTLESETGEQKTLTEDLFRLTYVEI